MDLTPHPALPALPANRQLSPILPPGLTDAELVARWLAVKSTGSGKLAATTLDTYRCEAERLFWYAARIARPPSAWTLDDAIAYLQFLQAPPAWAIGPRGARRGHPAWRPFLGPLSARSAGQAQVIATALFRWLVDVGYLKASPFAGIPLAGRKARPQQSRFLSEDECALLREAITARPVASDADRRRQARDAFLIELFARCGLRTTEALRARMRDIRLHPVPASLRRAHPEAPETKWLMTVQGKGGKVRLVPCGGLLPALQAYRSAYALPPLPSPDETGPLVLSVRRASPRYDHPVRASQLRELRDKHPRYPGIASRKAIYTILRGIFTDALVYWDGQGRPIDAQRLRDASTHWLRHSYGKQQLAAGVSLLNVSRNLGHEDIKTTTQYLDDEAIARAIETELYTDPRT